MTVNEAHDILFPRKAVEECPTCFSDERVNYSIKCYPSPVTGQPIQVICDDEWHEECEHEWFTEECQLCGAHIYCDLCGADKEY